MTTKLQLDHTALEYLFETLGEDFVLQIQAGVLNTAMKKYVKAASFSFKTCMLNPALFNSPISFFISSFIRRRTIGLSSSGTKVAVLLQRAVQKEIEGVIAKALNLEDMHTYADAQIQMAVNQMERAIKNKLDIKINDAISTHIDEEIKRRMALLKGEEYATIKH